MALRHVVLLKFAEGVVAQAKLELCRRFAALKQSVPGIEALEWGENTSAEGLDHGYTHAFLLTFGSDQARDAYLIHPEHVAFSEAAKPLLAAVTVLDYWSGA